MLIDQNFLGKPIEMGRDFSSSKRKNPLFLLVSFLSFLGFFFCLAEVILSASGKSLCHADTCEIVESFSLFSRPVLAALAACYFFLQGLLSLRIWKGGLKGLGFLIFMAATALGVESILLGRQFFDYHLSCPFCLTVAAFTISSGLLILLATRKFVVLGAILGVILALSLTPLSILPLSKAATERVYRGNPQEKLILIYAQNCPHCHEVLSFCQQLSDIDLLLCPRNKALAFMHSLDIKGVPILIVDRNGKKEVLVGSKLILSYLKGLTTKELPLPPLEDLLTPEGICSETQKCEP